MQIVGLLITVIVAAICCVGTVRSWPVSNPEIDSFMFSNAEQQPGPSLREIPQWHCLRYFKHDIHLMRRCRNYRMHMLRRPNDMI
ncbi:conserved hypothetical protein [Culex quinquefasciatus]|uniref:Uncharacterized protein n=2 Tax=Culex pipiens complex TaxID=518105 RepID=B0X956_CULQU|nr:uncharacterized protein LOC6049409 [Culex quinquefasciatus]XP_039437126.1 uncharacterized protein LOC120418719 [Culex pipiens pallens]EDS42962.1 conserved hypothetical protein [Culex quinquefasciatus]|eukprot:XP_001866178.1 conserved hypothetical protein [Culex quinquefasciatus]